MGLIQNFIFLSVLVLGQAFASFAFAQANSVDSSSSVLKTPLFLTDIFQNTMSDPDFNKSYIKSGCFVRAHWIAEMIDRAGYKPIKVFIETMTSKEKMHLKLPSGPSVGWVFHVTAGYKDSAGHIWVVDPILMKEVVPLKVWLDFIQDQNPKLRLLTHVTGPDVYHVDRVENAEFLVYGKPFSKHAMDFIKDAMNILFVWETFE